MATMRSADILFLKTFYYRVILALVFCFLLQSYNRIYLVTSTKVSDRVKVEAVPLSSRSVRLSWSTTDLVGKWQLQYRQKNSDQSYTVETHRNSHVFTDLNPFTTYEFKLSAVARPNSITGSVSAQTYPDRPSGPPTNVTVKETSSSSIIISWKPPPVRLRNGLVTSFKIRYKRKGSQGGNSKIVKFDHRSYALTDLKKDTPYSIKVAAVNINGTGPFSTWVHARTLTNTLDDTRIPGQPEKLEAQPVSNSIIVRWLPPKDRHIMVDQYVLGYGPNNPEVNKRFLPPNKLYYTINNVRPATMYVISIRARNRQGWGQERLATAMSKRRRGQETAEPIMPPIGLKAIVISPRTVLMTWTDSTLGRKKKITDHRFYMARYRPVGTSRYSYLNCTDLVAHISDLDPATKYEFSVKVINGPRQSTWSLTADNTTYTAAPGSAPRDVTVIPINTNKVLISWQPPLKSNGKITEYLVFYTNDPSRDEASWVLQRVSGDKLQTTLKNLTPDNVYYIKVQAHNDKGYGPLSKKIEYKSPNDHSNSGIHSPSRDNKKTKNNIGKDKGKDNWSKVWKGIQIGSKEHSAVQGVISSGRKNIEKSLGKDGLPRFVNGNHLDNIDYLYPKRNSTVSTLQGERTKRKALSGNVLIIVTACVASVCVIVVTVITFIICRRRASCSSHKSDKSSATYSSPPEQQPLTTPDLWAVSKQNGSSQSALVRDVEYRDNSVFNGHARHNSFMGDSRVSDRNILTSQLRPTGSSLSLGRGNHKDSIILSPTSPIPSHPVIPVRPVYPRTQFGIHPRVNAGDVVQSNSVKPFQPTNIARKVSLNSTPRSSASKRMTEATEEELEMTEMQKSMSTEKLTAEMENLEVLMRDLNEITQQDFQTCQANMCV